MNIEVYFNNGQRSINKECSNVIVGARYLCIKDKLGIKHNYSHDTINSFHVIDSEEEQNNEK